MRLLAFSLLLFGVPPLGGSELRAADFYVSPQGSDSNSGRSLKSPFQSITRAVELLSPGDTVHVLAGVYPERIELSEVSGEKGNPIRIQAYKDQVPVLDGAEIEVKKQTAMIMLENCNHVVIQGFEIRNLRSDAKKCVPIGILVIGEGNQIEIRNNHIHSIETLFNGKNGGDAHGIAVFGTEEKPIQQLVVDGNHLEKLKLGSSEALVLNGNVRQFSVTNNRVHDCNNIAIDLIGFEGFGPNPELDRVRDGICSGNEVYNIDTFENPAYGKSRSAGGIYVDGGTDIVIEHNRIYNCNIGVELASEHDEGSTSKITLRNNLIYRNQIGGVFIGGFSKKKGTTDHCAIYNNTLYENDLLNDGNGELYLQFSVKNNVIRNNIFVCSSQNLLVAHPREDSENNSIDYNFYGCKDGPEAAEFQWLKKRYQGWPAWLEATGMDAHSRFGDPQFIDPASGDFRLGPDSPCLDAGDPGFKPKADELDFAGQPRRGGKAVDAGAFEKSK